MKKLLVLIKKEVRELITLQMIVTMAVMIGLFVFIGNVVGEETKKIQYFSRYRGIGS